MERGKKYCYLVLSGCNEALTPRLARNNEIEVLQTNDPEEAISMIRNRFIDCIILQTDKETESVCNNYRVFSVQFPAIPILVILDNHNIELACRLGQLGAKHVTAAKGAKKMRNLLQQLIKRRQLRGGGYNFYFRA